MTIAEALRQGARLLTAAGIDSPRIEARALLARAMGRDTAWIVANPAADAAPYDDLLARRAAHEPLAYILGRREFWSLDFQVSPATLIPRADSETVVEAALAACTMRAPRVLDLGTGTGCLLLSVLRERPDATGFGVDIAPGAVVLAARNAQALGLSARAMFFRGDWNSALLSLGATVGGACLTRGADALRPLPQAGEVGGWPASGGFDLILSNPPYIVSADIAALMPEVAAHEPRSALDGGADGLAAYRTIVDALPRLLRPGGVAVLELGAGQDGAVATLAAAAGFDASFRADLAGISRAIVLRRGLS